MAMYGEKAIFYVAIFNLIFNLSIFTVGVPIMNYGKENSESFSLKSLKTPGVICSLLAIIIYFLNIKIPPTIGSACSSVGSITTPIAMLLIGSTLAKMDLKEVFNDFKVYLFSIVKQIIIPIAIWPILKLLIQNEYVLGITLVMILMPIANTSILFATEYKGNEGLAAKTVFMTTLISIVSIPIILSTFLV